MGYIDQIINSGYRFHSVMSEYNVQDLDQERGDEIDLRDIVDFLRGEWRKLLTAAVVTMLLVAALARRTLSRRPLPSP